MTRFKDFEVIGTVLFAAAFWFFIWKHEELGVWAHKVWISLPRAF